MTNPSPPRIYMEVNGEYGEHAIPGAEDWHLVTELGEGGGYDWTTMRIYYSPSARRYFWHGDSGCSCNSWADSIATIAGFDDGDRAAATRAVRAFAADNEYGVTASGAIDATAAVQTFKEPK